MQSTSRRPYCVSSACIGARYDLALAGHESSREDRVARPKHFLASLAVLANVFNFAVFTPGGASILYGPEFSMPNYLRPICSYYLALEATWNYFLATHT